ncbi:hypothetical protein FXW07_12640 [Methanosarcina sp. DH1]|uniref:hypothetical protein n=1 Tax=Methanosarcina sp. DH1 TaxID=2605695 RepID=UPI001E5EE27F|nr:hypothetical protein [Methanosarcina sp. DH1]MCC4767440.1 hypothetical protein [Methanosarcina sp. DH1]
MDREDLLMKKLPVIALLVLITEGLVCKLLVTLHLRLNSDNTNAGLIAMEFWKHHNYLFSGIYLPSLDPYYFTELIPFHLVLQRITNYDPMVLRLTVFIIFIGVLAIFSVLVYKITNKGLIPSLVFAAMLANVNMTAYENVYALALTHTGTLFFTGILLLLVLYLKKASTLQLGLITVLIALVVLSDTIVVAWFVLPFLAAYFLVNQGRSRNLNMWVISWTLLAGLVSVIKSMFIDYLVPNPFAVQNQASIFSNALEIFRQLSLYLNTGLYHVLTGGQTPSSIDILFTLIFLTALCIAIWNLGHATDHIMKSFAVIMAISAALMFTGLTFTSLSEGTYRYLGFTAISVFMILSFFTNSKNQLYIFLIAILLISSATANISSVTNLDSQPNARVNELVDYMESNNITYAYAYYWDAGITTYLANEKVIVRPVIFTDSGFIPYKWNSCVRWYNERPTEYFVIRNNDSQSNTPDAFVTAYKPDRVLYCGNYTLYHYSGLNATSVYDTWTLDEGNSWLRFKQRYLEG